MHKNAVKSVVPLQLRVMFNVYHRLHAKTYKLPFKVESRTLIKLIHGSRFNDIYCTLLYICADYLDAN